MPKYARCSQFHLLVSLNFFCVEWGFNMKGGAKSFGGSRKNYIFSSPLFLRDQPELCKSMVRMTKKNWKASRERKCKPKSMKPVASQTEVQMEPEQSEKQPSIPQLQPRAPQISVPVFMSIVPVPMWPMQAVNLPGQPYCPIPPQRSNLEMMHQLSSAREQYVDRQVPLARHIDTRTEPLKKACSIDQPRASKDIVTIRKQNTKVPLSKSELNAAIAMSMLDEVE